MVPTYFVGTRDRTFHRLCGSHLPASIGRHSWCFERNAVRCNGFRLADAKKPGSAGKTNRALARLLEVSNSHPSAGWRPRRQPPSV